MHAHASARTGYVFFGTLVDFGDAGRQNDSGIFGNSELGIALKAGTFSPSGCKPFPGFPSTSVPYVIVGDEGFPIKPYQEYIRESI